MKDSEIKDTLAVICELLKNHAEQMFEIQRRTIALVSCLDQKSKDLFAHQFSWPKDTQTAQKLEQSAASQLQSLEVLLRRLKD